uniref:Uncharacterized protein n=1 Tax=Oryza punctata TaxID=4537 RepID=A0A0E0KN75_ORYPU
MTTKSVIIRLRLHLRVSALSSLAGEAVDRKSKVEKLPFPMAQRSCPGTIRLDSTCNSTTESSLASCLRTALCFEAGNEVVVSNAKRYGLTGERQAHVVHHLPLLGIHVEGAGALVLLLHREQDVGADKGVGRDAHLRRIAVLQRVETEREDGCRACRRWRRGRGST